MAIYSEMLHRAVAAPLYRDSSFGCGACYSYRQPVVSSPATLRVAHQVCLVRFLLVAGAQEALSRGG